MIANVVGFILAAITVLYFYSQRKHKFWQSLRIEVPPSLPFLGHFVDLYLKPEKWKYIDELYKNYKHLPYWGMYEINSPELYLRDIDIIKDVMVKKFDHFTDRKSFPVNDRGSRNDALFKKMLLIQEGRDWKNLRSIMTPTFTSGKIKAMFTTVSLKADELLSVLDSKRQMDPVIEVRKPMGQYTLGVIAATAFGLDRTLAEDETVFEKNVERLSSVGVLTVLKFLALSVLPSRISQLTGISISSNVTSYFARVVEESMEERKKKNIYRGDFVDLMENCYEESVRSTNPKFKMTREVMVSQSILFLFAGYDTTSNALANTLFLLAKHPDAQDKLRQELSRIRKSEEFSYQNIMEAEYLDGCFSESLRMFPVAHFTQRKCTEDYEIQKTGLVVKKGMLLSIPTWSLHYDEKYWSEPHSYQPERFLPQNKKKIIPFTYIPFGAGPRNCIGMRFALLEAKLAVAKVISSFKLTTPVGHEELVFSKEAFALRTTHHGVRIHFHKIP